MSVSLPVSPSDTPVAVPGTLPEPAAPSPAEVVAGAVRATFADFSALIDAGDFGGAAAFYADDPRFTWVEDGVVRYRSRADVTRAFEHLRLIGLVRFAYGEPTIEVLARDLAVLAVSFETVVGDGPQRYAFGGAMTATMARTSAGWRFLVGHSSSRRPRPAPR